MIDHCHFNKILVQNNVQNKKRKVSTSWFSVLRFPWAVFFIPNRNFNSMCLFCPDNDARLWRLFMAHMPTTCRRWRWILKSHQKPWNIPDRWYPIGSMYAIYGNIYHQYTPNVSIYTIHGSYGYMKTAFDPHLWVSFSGWWFQIYSCSSQPISGIGITRTQLLSHPACPVCPVGSVFGAFLAGYGSRLSWYLT